MTGYNNGIQYYYSDELIKYCNLDSKKNYYMNYILSCLENKLTKKWGKYELDIFLKNLYMGTSNYNWCPTNISRTGLLRLIRQNRVSTFDNKYNDIIKLNIYNNGINIQEICV